MATDVLASPEIIAWARDRSRVSNLDLERRFPRLGDWIEGTVEPTWNQLKKYATATGVPVGVFFRAEVPIDALPIADFRTIANKRVSKPSPDLLDVISDAQRRQDWFRSYAEEGGYEPTSLVGSLNESMDRDAAASVVRASLGIENDRFPRSGSFASLLSRMRQHLEGEGVLVMSNGVVGANTHRGLDPEEFRGFALSDPLAPVIFINGKDWKGAQNFTLAHETIHLGLGRSGVSDASPQLEPDRKSVEDWVNAVTAEVLVPRESLTRLFSRKESLVDGTNRLALSFKVSAQVILRKLHDDRLIEGRDYWNTRDQLLSRPTDDQDRNGSGNFYNLHFARVGKRLTSAIIIDTLQGNTPYTQAYKLLGISSQSTFDKLADRLGVT